MTGLDESNLALLLSLRPRFRQAVFYFLGIDETVGCGKLRSDMKGTQIVLIGREKGVSVTFKSPRGVEGRVKVFTNGYNHEISWIRTQQGDGDTISLHSRTINLDDSQTERIRTRIREYLARK